MAARRLERRHIDRPPRIRKQLPCDARVFLRYVYMCIDWPLFARRRGRSRFTRSLAMTEQETKIADAVAYREDAKIRAQRRRLAPPSPQRDLTIFKMVVIEHFSHGEVARRMGLGRS